MNIPNPTTSGEPHASSWEASFTLTILFITLLLSFIDRQIVAILVQPIKRDLHLSDLQIGLLSGASFAILYVSASFPLARLADRGNRRNLVSLCIGLWSLMTMLAGFSYGFIQIALARMGVAIGEAGGQPASYSMAYDLVGPKRLVFAIGLLNCAAAIGLGMGILLGGWLNDAIGWRHAFIVLGAPGLLIAVVLRFAVREPKRIAGVDSAPQVGLGEALRYFWRIRSFRTLVWVPTFMAISSYAILGWMPAFFMRVNGFSSTKVGFGVGMATILAAPPGALLAGVIADRLRPYGLHWQIRVAGVAMLCAIPPILVALFAKSFPVAIAGYGVYQLFGIVQQPICFATAVQLAGPNMRASAAALITITLNFFGLTLGPLLVGSLNDLLRHSYGEGAIRYSICIALIGMPLSIIMAWITQRRIWRDAAAAANVPMGVASTV
jgi:MFS family permease